jgi:hypothetical protein
MTGGAEYVAEFTAVAESLRLTTTDLLHDCQARQAWPQAAATAEMGDLLAAILHSLSNLARDL